MQTAACFFRLFLKMMKLDARKAIATSLFSTVFMATVAVCVYWYRGNVMQIPAISTIIDAMIGARIGGRISLKTKPKYLQTLLTILILAIISTLKIIKIL
ncbi:MAG: hypothetical protein DRN04_06095 [Thermoprotei archaeon]|nr:MAG: hypothetical protein DRN04_06095 [Thermoprotei archaeon]